MTGRSKLFSGVLDKVDSQTLAWLPQGPAKLPALSAALSVGILLFIIAAALTTVSIEPLVKFQVELQRRFMFGEFALRILDAIVTAILLTPVWFVYGVVTALLYRLALSLTTSTGKYRGFEQTNVIYIIIGFAAGLLLWPMTERASVSPVLTVWLAQLFSLACVLLLLLSYPKGAGKGRQNEYEFTGGVQTRVKTSALKASLAVLFCSILIGGVLPLFGYLLKLSSTYISPTQYGGFVLICMASGMYLSYRSGFDKGRYMSIIVSLMRWAVAAVTVIFIWDILWRQLCESGTANPLLRYLCWAFVAVSMGALGSVAAECKQMEQTTAVSRTLGWSRWFVISALGYIVGHAFFIYGMLPAWGSLMTFTVLLLGAVLASSIMAIFNNDRRYHNRTLYAGVIIAFLCSLIILKLTNGWLVNSAQSQTVLRENVSDAWQLTKYPDGHRFVTNQIHLHCGGCDQADNYPEYNRNWLAAASSLFQRQRILILGMNYNVWPPPVTSEHCEIDLVLDPVVCNWLDKLKIMPAPNFGNSRILYSPGPLYLWRRQSNRIYDLIWDKIPDCELAANEYSYNNTRWRRLFSSLKADGAVLVQIDRVANITGSTESALRLRNQLQTGYRGSGAVLKADFQDGPSGSSSQLSKYQPIFFILCKSEVALQLWLDRFTGGVFEMKWRADCFSGKTLK